MFFRNKNTFILSYYIVPNHKIMTTHKHEQWTNENRKCNGEDKTRIMNMCCMIFLSKI